MFGVLTEKLQSLFSSFGKGSKLTEESLSDAIRQVRLALLEADVNYSVAGTLVKRIKEKALGKELIKSVTPKDQFISIVHEELVTLMGSEQATVHFTGKPTVVMLCGLQGSGKTTQAVKLAYHFKQQNKKVLIAACDLQRPAAILQLKNLAKQENIPVFSLEGVTGATLVAKKALQQATEEKADLLIIDTAGRLHVDDDLMKELEEMKKETMPHEIFFVANATMGQDAVNVALEFDKRISITGSILTMLDGDTRAGAAISIFEVTKKPLKFEGVGEKIFDLQPFNPKSMADRILGMGDVINLVRKAKEQMDEKESEKLAKKMIKAEFTYCDYLTQMGMIRKMGSMKSLFKMIPGMSMLKDFDMPEEELKKIESIILSMTLKERQELVELDYSRKKRIAKGSGTLLEDVNRLVKGFKQIKMFMKKMPSLMGKGGMPNLNDMKKGLWG